MRAVALAVAFFTSTSAYAGAQAAPFLTLRAALGEADVHNSEILAATRAIDVARAGVTQAALAPLQARVVPAVTQDVPQGLGTLQTFAAGASQQLSPALGVRRSAAAAGVAIAQAVLAGVQRDVDRRVIAAYFVLAAAQAVVQAAQQSIDSARQLESSAQRRQRVGAVGSFEVLRTHVELQRAQTDLLRAQASQRTSQIALDLLLGRPTGEPVTAILPASEPAPPNLQTLFLRAAQLDPTLAQLRESINQASAQQRAAHLERAPSVELAAGYLFQRAPGVNGVSSSGPTASVAFTLPLLDYGTIRGAVDEARARQAVAQAQIQGRDAQLRAEIEADTVELASAQARFSFSRASLSQAQEGLRIAQFGYRKGALSILDVLSARNQLAAAQAEMRQAAADLGASIAQLQLLVGEPVSP